jgi:hypothetical protein
MGKKGVGVVAMDANQVKIVANCESEKKREGRVGADPIDGLALIPLCQDPDGSLTINRWKRGKLEHSRLRSINCRK